MHCRCYPSLLIVEWLRNFIFVLVYSRRPLGNSDCRNAVNRFEANFEVQKLSSNSISYGRRQEFITIQMLTDGNNPVIVGVIQINKYKCLNQLVMHLWVRKPVVNANRSGCTYEIPDMTWFCQAE